MADNGAELIPQDEAIYSQWETGMSMRSLARQFGVSVTEIERALDRMLPTFDAQNQLRAFKRELMRLETLASQFYSIVHQDPAKNTECAHLVARLNERVCSMRGWSPMNIRIGVDPLATQAEQATAEFDQVEQAILRIARGNGNGAGDVLSPSDDTAQKP